VDFPASSPYVLAVGGTKLVGTNGNSPTISSETVWNETVQSEGAGGGGVSAVFREAGLPERRQGPDFGKSAASYRARRAGRGCRADPETGRRRNAHRWSELGIDRRYQRGAPLWAASHRPAEPGPESALRISESGDIYEMFKRHPSRHHHREQWSILGRPGMGCLHGTRQPAGERLFAALSGTPAVANRFRRLTATVLKARSSSAPASSRHASPRKSPP